MRQVVPCLILLGALLAGDSQQVLLASDLPQAPPQRLPHYTYAPHPLLFTEQLEQEERAAEAGHYGASSSGRTDGSGQAVSEDDAVLPDKIQLVQYPFESSAAEDITPEAVVASPGWNPAEHIRKQLSKIPPDERGLRFKDTSATMTVLPGSTSPDSFLFSTLDIRTSAYFAQLPVLTITPRFGWHLTDGPGNTDVPSQLFDTGINTSLMLPLSERLAVIMSVGPGMFSDGRNLTSDAFRMTGMAIGFYEWSETTKIAFGFMYLGREDLKAIPAAGLYLEPNERLKIDVVFPRPKVAYRLRFDGQTAHWCYLAGELGGGSWAIERDSGLNDVISYRDLRLIAGFEQADLKSIRWMIEGGFVFSRNLEYESGGSKIDLDPTGMIRAGWIF